jgi:hypothetical protein
MRLQSLSAVLGQFKAEAVAPSPYPLCLVILVLVQQPKVSHSRSDEILIEVRVTISVLASSPGEVPTAVCVLPSVPVSGRGTTATPCALELFDEMSRLEKRLGAATPQF